MKYTNRSGVITAVPRIRAFFRRAKEDSVPAFAAQSAFFALLAMVPFVMLLLSSLSLLPVNADDVSQAVYDLLPPLFTDFLKNAFSPDLLTNVGRGLTVVSIVTALWSSSRGIFALIQGLNSVCRVNETRGYFKLRLCAAGYTLVFVVLLMISLALVLSGIGADQKLRQLFPDAEWLFFLISMRSVISCGLLTGLFLLMFSFLPCKREKLRTRLPGALAAAVGWIIFSGVFSFYAAHVADYSRLYGGLAAVALIMLWLYFCMYILFLGAELNEFLER